LQYINNPTNALEVCANQVTKGHARKVWKTVVESTEDWGREFSKLQEGVPQLLL